MAVLALAGCTAAGTSSQPPVEAHSPAEKSVSSPTPSPTSEVASGPVLGPDGIGGVRLGMNLDAVRQLPDVSRVTRAEGAADCSTFSVGEGGPTNRWAVDGMASADRGVIWLEVRRGAPTVDGIGLGATVQEVRDAYPEAVGDFTSFVSVQASPGAMYHFRMRDGQVTQLRLVGDESACFGH